MKRYLLVITFLLMLLLTACKSKQEEVQVQPGGDNGEIGTFVEPPTPTKYTFTTDRHAVSADAAEYLGSAAADYNALLDAVCTGKTAMTAESAENAHRAAVVFESSPYNAFADVQVNSASFNITYTGDGDAETFDNAVKAIVEERVFAESNPVERAIGMYEAVAADFKVQEKDEADLYHAVLNKKGSEETLAEVLNYLFVQNGIPSRMACGTTDGADMNYWVIAELSGKLYHFDPVQENGQATLRGFAMSDSKYMELFDEGVYTTGAGEYAQQMKELCPDTTFDALFRGTTSYRLDAVNHYIYLSTDASDDYRVSVNTETLGAAAG